MGERNFTLFFFFVCTVKFYYNYTKKTIGRIQMLIALVI